MTSFSIHERPVDLPEGDKKRTFSKTSLGSGSEILTVIGESSIDQEIWSLADFDPDDLTSEGSRFMLRDELFHNFQRLFSSMTPSESFSVLIYGPSSEAGSEVDRTGFEQGPKMETISFGWDGLVISNTEWGRMCESGTLPLDKSISFARLMGCKGTDDSISKICHQYAPMMSAGYPGQNHLAFFTLKSHRTNPETKILLAQLFPHEDGRFDCALDCTQQVWSYFFPWDVALNDVDLFRKFDPKYHA